MMKHVDAIMIDSTGLLYLQKNGNTWAQKCPFSGGKTICGYWCVHFGEVEKLRPEIGVTPFFETPENKPYNWKLPLTCGWGITVVAKETNRPEVITLKDGEKAFKCFMPKETKRCKHEHDR
jgi:hypothetical protein